MCAVNNQKKQAASKKSILGSKLNSKAAIQAVKTSSLPATRKSVTAKPVPAKNTVKEVKVAKIISASDSISISSSSKSVSSLPLPDEVGDVGGNLESLVVDENFRTALKDFRKANAPKKLVRTVADHSESGMLDQNMTVHAFRTLQRMNRYYNVKFFFCSSIKCIQKAECLNDTLDLPELQFTFEPSYLAGTISVRISSRSGTSLWIV